MSTLGNNSAEWAFASLLLRYHREAGEAAAAKLRQDMTDAVADGASRGDLARLAEAAVATLPVRH